MHFETKDDLLENWRRQTNANLKNTGDIKTDIMLISLLVKMLDIISASDSTSYDSLKTICEQETKRLKSSLRNKVPKTTVAEEKEESKMSQRDKKFVIDTLMNVISGEKKKQFTWDKDGLFRDYLHETLANWDDKNEDTSCSPF